MRPRKDVNATVEYRRPNEPDRSEHAKPNTPDEVTGVAEAITFALVTALPGVDNK